MPKQALCMVVDPSKELIGLAGGGVERAWDAAVQSSRRAHIITKPQAFHTILSCAPTMYSELWTGGKCMYKLEPVLADDGELIIYAPHIHQISSTHGSTILEVGYHCRDYFRKQWETYRRIPWSTLAHSSHVRGIGTFENGIEHCRAKVTLATGIPPETCARINLGYRDPSSIDIESFANREENGVLLVRRAGEMLYQLDNPPAWARA